MDMSIRFPNIDLNLGRIAKTVSIFGYEVTVYGILLVAGMLLGLMVIVLQAKRQNQNPNICLGMSIAGLVGSVIGARLYYVAFSWELFKDQPVSAIVDIRSGGLAFYGGIFGGMLFAWIYCSILKVSFGRMADIASIGLLSGQIIGIWGNFFNRASFGGYTDSLFAMQLPLNAVQSSEVTKNIREHLVTVNDVVYVQVHPLFFYECIWCVFLLIILLFYTRRKKYQGEIFTRYLAGYGFGRIFVEWMRTDSLKIPHTEISVSLVLSVLVFVVCGVMATVRRILSKKRESIRRRRKEESSGTDEKMSQKVHSFESVQDEFRDILEGQDTGKNLSVEEKEASSQNTEAETETEQKDQGETGSGKVSENKPETGQTDGTDV